LKILDHTQLDTHTHPHPVGLLWTSYRSVAETSAWQQSTVTTDKHPCRRRNSKPQSQRASGRRSTL